MSEKEDYHFLIDNASPPEIEHVLSCLDLRVAYSTQELRQRLLSEWGYSAQRNLTFSTRRLFDLGLTSKATTALRKPGHLLTGLEARIRSILAVDHDLYAEVMHFLHYDRYDDTPLSRKLFWSYRTCCDIVWRAKGLPPDRELAMEVQSRIAERFPSAYARRMGGNFNAGGVNSGWKPWVAQLRPSPLASEGRALIPRWTDRFDLAGLALDHVYRSRGYRYQDPVILDDQLLDEVSRVFFLDPACCRELIDLATRLTKAIKLSDTFSGTSVTLLAPYGIERI